MTPATPGPAPAVPVVAIDGPSGAGKGTVARLVATRLGWHWLDSGALYRVVGLVGRRHGLVAGDEAGHAELAARVDIVFGGDAAGDAVWADGADLSAELRTEEVGRLASAVAAQPRVRAALTGRQQAFRRLPGLVADGRDMGSAIFPDATLKVFLTASVDERAGRRYKQLKDKGLSVSLADLSRDIEERDRRDAGRAASPLTRTDDAVLVDSTGRTIDAVVAEVLQLALDRGLRPAGR